MAKLGDKNMLPLIFDIAARNDAPIFTLLAAGAYGRLEDPAAVPYLERLITRYEKRAATPEDANNLQNISAILEYLKDPEKKREVPGSADL